MLRFVAILAVVSCGQSVPITLSGKQENSEEPRQILYLAQRAQELQNAQQRQQFAPQVSERQQQYPQDFFALLEPQYQVPGINFLQDKQPAFPRIQPQIVLYGPGGQGGQPFLLQPGSPPGNFLVPQPGPNVIIRDQPQPQPPRPVFVAGYPKPAHIPPVEKDAEEIPTNPARIPPLGSGKKPEKLETFNEGKTATEADGLAAADRNPQLLPRTNLKPGQRFFILNGQHLFTNYPYQPYVNPQINLKYAQPEGPQFLQKSETDVNHTPIQDLLLRNAVTGQISDVQNQFDAPAQYDARFPQNSVSLNQPQHQDFFRTANLPLQFSREAIRPQVQFNDAYFQYQGDDGENDAIIIDAKVQEDDASSTDTESESVSRPEKQPEPSVSQAAPGAIALAGPGGVAGAAPRGTALVGKGGLAVSSPQATAVAGPSKSSESEQKTKKPTAKKN